jgi:hypothetical protein
MMEDATEDSPLPEPQAKALGEAMRLLVKAQDIVYEASLAEQTRWWRDHPGTQFDGSEEYCAPLSHLLASLDTAIRDLLKFSAGGTGGVGH